MEYHSKKELIIEQCLELANFLKNATFEEIQGHYGHTNKRCSIKRKMRELRFNTKEYEKDIYGIE